MSISGAPDAIRRVGVNDVKAEMSCAILGRARTKEGEEGIAMRLAYKATCSGVWFPGAATLLGLDVGLESANYDAHWLPGSRQGWEVNGGPAYLGFNIGSLPRSRVQSIEAPEVTFSAATPNGRAAPTESMLRYNASNSVSSLLRAPLPAQNVPDYSFESSPSPSPAGTVSSLSVPTSGYFASKNRGSTPNGTPDVQVADNDKSPGLPITIHLNINDLLTPGKNIFTFSISGTVLIIPHPDVSSSRSSQRLLDDSALDVIPVPRFHVLVAESESIASTVRNEINDSTVEIYNAKGDIRDAQTRKTVVQPGSEGRCGSSGGRIAIKTFAKAIKEERSPDSERPHVTSKRSQMQDEYPHARSRANSTVSLRETRHSETPRTRRRRDGPLNIPYVRARVTPMSTHHDGSLDHSLKTAMPDMYSVSLSLPAPADADTEWLEFGLSLPDSAATSAEASSGKAVRNDAQPPRVEIVCASVGGIPTRYESTVAFPQSQDRNDIQASDQVGKVWVSWVRVHVGAAGGDNVRVAYIVKVGDDLADSGLHSTAKRTAGNSATWGIFLPSFSLPVAELQVDVEPPAGVLHFWSG
jgi:hypothetical protein